MRPARPVAILLLALAALPAAHAALVEEVGGSDPDVGDALRMRHVVFSFLDANGNGKADRIDPTEPLYLDLDGSDDVTYRDLRLSPYGDYPAGSSVNVTDGDVGRPLNALSGWFARGTVGWVADLDGSLTLTPGDLLLGDGAPVAIVQQTATGETLRGLGAAGFLGTGLAPNVHYLDADVATSGGAVSDGDLRLNPGPFAAKAAPATLPPSPTPGPAPGPMPAPTPETAATAPARMDSWRPLDWVLVALAVANLAALAFLYRAQRPRNPFQ